MGTVIFRPQLESFDDLVRPKLCEIWKGVAIMKSISLPLMAIVTLAAGATAPAAEALAALTQAPVVMRLSKDEFSIAFGIDAQRCASNGSNGVIRYRVDWKADDGTTRSETKLVNYTVPASASRTIAVDRQYFHSAEGQHTTDVVTVSVNSITCSGGG
jgi:hypothetical protein